MTGAYEEIAMGGLILQPDFVILPGGVGEDRCGRQLIMSCCVDKSRSSGGRGSQHKPCPMAGDVR